MADSEIGEHRKAEQPAEFDKKSGTGTGTRVFKKASPSNKITTYLGKRDFLDRGDHVDLIDGMVLVNDEYIASGKKITVQLLAAFRYGREDLDVLGLTFRKDLITQTYQVFPHQPDQQNKPKPMTRLQDRLKKKLGACAFPFWFEIPPNSASSVTLQPAQGDNSKPCGVDYEIKTFVTSGDSPSQKPRKADTVRLAIRKLTYCPQVEKPQPMIDVTKEFMISPGGLHLEASLDKEMYYHGETIFVNVHIQNNSNKTVRRIKVSVVQVADICIFTTAQYSCDVDKIDSTEGFPVGPGSTLSKIYSLCPLLSNNLDKRGLALDGQLKHEDTNLATSTIMSPSNHTLRENLGIIVQYKVKIKLLLGTLSGELVAELPFTLTHPKPPDSPKRERDLRNGREGPNQIAKDGTLITEGTGENSAMDTSNTLPKDDDVDLMRFDSEDDDIVFEDFARLRIRKNDADDSKLTDVDA